MSSKHPVITAWRLYDYFASIPADQVIGYAGEEDTCPLRAYMTEEQGLSEAHVSIDYRTFRDQAGRKQTRPNSELLSEFVLLIDDTYHLPDKRQGVTAGMAQRALFDAVERQTGNALIAHPDGRRLTLGAS